MIDTWQLTLKDIEDMVRVENETWGKELIASRAVITERLKIFQEGFIGGYVDGRLSGMIYGHPIKEVKRTWSENSSREAFDPDGEVYYVQGC